MFQLVCKATRCKYHNGGTWNNCRRFEDRNERDFDIVKLDDAGRCRYFTEKVAVASPGNGSVQPAKDGRPVIAFSASR